MSDTERIRILLIQRDPITLAGLISTFARYPGLEVVDREGWDADIEFSPCRLSREFVDVVVTDYAHGLSLAQMGRQSARCGSELTFKIVIFAPNEREWEIRRALADGVRGYILVGCALDELVKCVRSVHAGARYLSAEVSQKLADSLSTDPLTSREEQVLRLVISGMNNKAIARRLDIAVGTVKSHMKGVFDKLSVDSRTKAIHAAAQRGLLRDLAETSETPTASPVRPQMARPRMADSAYEQSSSMSG